MSTLHCSHENGADLYVKERQKIRHYRARSTEEKRRSRRRKNAKSRFFTSRGAYVNCAIKQHFLNVQKIGMLMQKRTDTRGVGISSKRKSIYLLTTKPNSHTH